MLVKVFSNFNVVIDIRYLLSTGIDLIRYVISGWYPFLIANNISLYIILYTIYIIITKPINFYNI